VNQTQLKGSFQLLDDHKLLFGADATNDSNRSAYSNVQQNDWGGLRAANGGSIVYPAGIWHPANMADYFKNISGGKDPNFSGAFQTFNFEEVRAIAEQQGIDPENFMPKSSWDQDSRTSERSKSLYVQINSDWDTALPLHTALGVRYEKTDVTSTAQTQEGNSIEWGSNNEFNVIFGNPTFQTLTGNYSYFLPSFDSDVDIAKDMKIRASYGESIGRPTWDQLQGGLSLTTPGRVLGGQGNVGNPTLKPVKSKNLDLSYEWYYTKHSYVSVGYFKKNLTDYAGQTVYTDTPYNLHTPAGGALWNEAIAVGGCAATDPTCIRNYIFTNHPNDPGVHPTGVDSQGNKTGVIVGQPSDPLMPFNITTFANQNSSNIHGLEFNIQHMFGNSGFGFAANYTYVNSNLRYDNSNMKDQFALLGLSNSSNLVGIYEDASWSIRAAYNWRGEFLSSTIDGGGRPNPTYTEPYGQMDLSVDYNIDKNLSLMFEAINLNNAYIRQHSRTESELISVVQTGPRYTIGARYKF
jgi:TonB-dependent receptor